MTRAKRSSHKQAKDDILSKEDLRAVRFGAALARFENTISSEDVAILRAWVETGDLGAAVRKVRPGKRWQTAWYARRLREMEIRDVNLIMCLRPGRKRDLLLRQIRPEDDGPRLSTRARSARLSKMHRAERRRV